MAGTVGVVEVEVEDVEDIQAPTQRRWAEAAAGNSFNRRGSSSSIFTTMARFTVYGLSECSDCPCLAICTPPKIRPKQHLGVLRGCCSDQLSAAIPVLDLYVLPLSALYINISMFSEKG